MNLDTNSPATRRRLARALMALSVALVLVGAGFVAYPTYTDIRADQLQKRLEKAFRSDKARQDFRAGTVDDGAPLTRILIPKLDVDAVAVEGVTLKALRAGAGHYPDTPLPGEPGNVAFAGHRTTFGKPFADIDRLKLGDQVVLATPVGRYTYEVTKLPWVTGPDDWSVVEAMPGSMLTLTTCHPRGSAEQRLIVRAQLAKSEPL